MKIRISNDSPPELLLNNSLPPFVNAALNQHFFFKNFFINKLIFFCLYKNYKLITKTEIDIFCAK